MKILLATDGSEFGKEATEECGELINGLRDVTVKIITVADYTAEAASEPFMSSEDFVKAVEKEMRRRSDEILSDAKKIVSYENSDVKIETEMLVGSAKKLIVKEAEDWNPDLVVVGSHGYGVLTRALLGSVSDAVLSHVKCSVLVVRKKK